MAAASASLDDEINKLKAAVASNECEFDDLPVGICSECAQHSNVFVPIEKNNKDTKVEIVSISKQQFTNSDRRADETIASSTKITSSSSSSSSSSTSSSSSLGHRHHQPVAVPAVVVSSSSSSSSPCKHVHQSAGQHHHHHHHHQGHHSQHQHHQQQQQQTHNHLPRCQLLPPLPDGRCPIHFGNLYKQCEVKPELYGDVYALKFVDLDKYGLSQYKDFVSSFK